MCGRFSSTLSAEFIRRLFGREGDIPNLGPSWNLAPSHDALVVRRHPEMGTRRLDALFWGLAPKTASPINAKAESVATAPAFRGAFSNRRCIVPANLFFAKKTNRRPPYAIAHKDEAPLALGGI